MLDAGRRYAEKFCEHHLAERNARIDNKNQSANEPFQGFAYIAPRAQRFSGSLAPTGHVKIEFDSLSLQRLPVVLWGVIFGQQSAPDEPG